jgi:hypothetical protein
MDEGGSTNEAFLSEEVQCGRPLGRTPLLVTLEDILRRVPDMGIALHGDPFTFEENLKAGEGIVWGDFE